MRTTLTLDDDVAAKLKSLARRTGRAFRDVVNDTLRRGLARRPAPSPLQPVKFASRPLRLKAGLSLDKISALLEQVEGPLHR